MTQDVQQLLSLHSSRVQEQRGHTHPLGQTLIVTAGCGWAQREGGPIEEIHPGDVVWFAANEKALARSHINYSDDTHCHPGKPKWKSG
jgi:quercetin dioxygenase-like cupin family protein